MHVSENKQDIACSLGFFSFQGERFLKNTFINVSLVVRETIIDDAFKRHEISSHSDYVPNGQLPAAVS